MKSLCLLVFLFVGAVFADVYMQNPRGSNDRLDEKGDRQNANRLFDSQNNARGGYASGTNTGAMIYYEGSFLPIQWTAQHACGSDQVECNFVLQYMCTDPKNDPASVALRDGLTTQRIQDNADQYNQQTTVNGVTGYQYGMHESYQSYQDCKARERNKGLFTADLTLNGNDARYTRQNQGGTQNGFECTEERDYYPYWAPSQWKDIAVLSPNEKLCDYFKKESQNVKDREYCTGAQNKNGQAIKQPLNQVNCTQAGGTWNTAKAHGIAAPDCQVASFSRDNHLGNGDSGETANYNWVIPSNEPCAEKGSCDCALRLRYNISTANTKNWGEEANDAGDNGNLSPVKNNPVQQVEGDDLQMALNTNQYGRTFQDRSYMFHIAKRPAGVDADQKIYNLNVRGKRGNIVQTFPATEYDFVPNNLHVTEGDFVHFQWTGSDNNDGNAAGEGIAGTDRSNIVQVSSLNSNVPLTQAEIDSGNSMFDSNTLRHHLAFTGQTNCPTIADLLKKNNNNQGAVNVDPTNCAKLNAAPAYFDAGPVRVNKTGTFYYMSSRNNNFSNRTQKGMLVVGPKPGLSAGVIAAIVIVSALAAVGLAFAGTVLYARRYPLSGMARFYDKHTPDFSRLAFWKKGSSSASSMSYSAASSDRKEPLLG